jgi:ribonuclease HI
MKAIMYFDGGSRGNPGNAGSGAALFVGGIEVASVNASLPFGSTNNEAEYMGLIKGMELAIDCGYDEIEIFGDSLLVVNQVHSVWKCKKERLQVLLSDVGILRKRFKTFELSHVFRKDNSRADELANEAMDRTA